MRKLGQIGRFEFLEASRSYKHAAAILAWAEVRYDQPISESDIEQIAARECWADMASVNMQLHGDSISLMEDRIEGFEIVRNRKAEVALNAWRRLHNTSVIPVALFGAYSCWRICLRPRKLGK